MRLRPAANSADIGKLADLTISQGWQVAVHDYLRYVDPEGYRYATDPQAASWRLLVDCGAEAGVLFVHPGISIAPLLLAQDGAQVTCLCAADDECRYLAARARQQGFGERLAAVFWDGEASLPRRDGQTDVAVLSDGVSGGLAEVWRVLADGGRILVMGGRRRDGALLRRHGFVDVCRFGVVPSCRQPFFIVPLDQPAGLRHALLRMAGGYDFSPALSPGAWALWRRFALPLVKLLGATELVCLARGFMPAYAFCGRKVGRSD